MMDVLFCELRDLLKRSYPASLRVSVLRCKVPKDRCGDCIRKTGYFRIRVSSECTSQEALDTLIHEWAHAIAWDEWIETGTHGKQWAEAYARAYQAYEQTVCVK